MGRLYDNSIHVLQAEKGMRNQKAYEKTGLAAFFVLFFIFVTGLANATGEGSSVATVSEQPGKWSAARQEVVEVAKAIGEASCESWDKTKDATAKSYEEMKKKGVEVWSKTKEKSGELVDKTVDASGEALDCAAEKSKRAWESTKEGSVELVDKTKSQVHEMTAPRPE